jgi:hypothetical protein
MGEPIEAQDRKNGMVNGDHMQSPELLTRKRTSLEKKILREIGTFETDTGFQVTSVMVQSHIDAGSGVPKSTRVVVVAQIR